MLNYFIMIRWLCNVTLKCRKPSSELWQRFGLDIIRNCIRRGRFRWFVHVERCSDDSMVKKCRDIIVKGQKERVDLERLGTTSWIVVFLFYLFLFFLNIIWKRKNNIKKREMGWSQKGLEHNISIFSSFTPPPSVTSP